MIEVSFMHRVDSFNYISFFVLCIFYILDLLGELFLEHAPRATHVAPAGDQVPAGTVLATPALQDTWVLSLTTISILT